MICSPLGAFSMKTSCHVPAPMRLSDEWYSALALVFLMLLFYILSHSEFKCQWMSWIIWRSDVHFVLNGTHELPRGNILFHNNLFLLYFISIMCQCVSFRQLRTGRKLQVQLSHAAVFWRFVFTRAFEGLSTSSLALQWENKWTPKFPGRMLDDCLRAHYTKCPLTKFTAF